MLPIVVDLDETLVLTDTLHEDFIRLARDYPLDLFRVPGWMSAGRAFLKRQLLARTEINAALLPYNTPLIEWLKQERAAGRRIVLCTASDEKTARAVAAELDIFDEIMASDGERNLTGAVKAEELVKRFGLKQFDYVGDSKADIRVWEKANKAIVVNASPEVLEGARRVADVERVFPRQAPGVKTLLRMLRVHQWMKNILLFAPCAAAHRLYQGTDILLLVVAFFAFGLCASSVYITNDLLDLESDRAHPRKRLRPFASGAVPVSRGAILAPALFVVSICLAALVSWPFLAWMLVYFVLTSAYSLFLKRLVLIDCIVLALLYTIRVIAGAAAIAIPLSFWMLALSVFLFLSLAFVKRCAELQVQSARGHEKAHGRGYYITDAPLVQTLGVVSGYAAVLVLALYINSDAVRMLYRRFEIIWAAVPVLLFWVSWIWLKVQRGEMNDDPVIFALKDRTSLVTGMIFVLTFALGAWV
ncbi:MAG: UbiA family prenyltransferase [Methylobacteriaceae bacterium]|nr:UbiA family prenyltransferase [Methylobacteriaceae bacterium]